MHACKHTHTHTHVMIDSQKNNNTETGRVFTTHNINMFNGFMLSVTGHTASLRDVHEHVVIS